MKRHTSTFLAILFSIICLLFVTGCDTSMHDNEPVNSKNGETAAKSESVVQPRDHAKAEDNSGILAGSINGYAYQSSGNTQQAAVKPVSMERPDASSAESDERKIIRNAEFTINAKNPGEAQRRISAIAEAHGGFVVKSEVNKSSSDSQDGAAYTSVAIVLRCRY